MQKMSKYVRMCALLLISAMLLTACGGNSNDGTKDSVNNENTDKQTESRNKDEAQDEEETPQTTVKSDGYEKFSQLKIGMTESEVNAILGEPTKVDKAYYYYNITVNGQDLELTVWINTVSGVVTYIAGDFRASEYRAEFADSATDLSGAGGLENGEIATYDDCVSAFKTSGYMTSIDEDGVKEYLWVDGADGYMSVTFNADGTVKTYSGYC